MIPFKYHQPETIGEALDLLEYLPGSKQVLAGGTDLVLSLRRGDTNPEHLISLKQLDSLKGMHLVNGKFHIGALVTFAEIAESLLFGPPYLLLAEAARQVGAPQIRNQGTIGGNIVNASTAGDMLPPLLALKASVKLLKKGSERVVPLDSFLVSMNKTAIQPDEILSEVVFSALPNQAASSFVKLGRRNSLAISRLSLAVILFYGKDKTIEDACISLGAAGPRPFRATVVEERLKNSNPDSGLLEEVIDLFSQTVSTSLGNRASQPYKRVAVRGVARQAFCNTEPRFGSM